MALVQRCLTACPWQAQQCRAHRTPRTHAAVATSHVFQRRALAGVAHGRCISRRRQLVARAQQGEDRSSPSAGQDSDLVYVGKIALASAIGAAVIKYGSLLTDVPFNPNSGIAAACVFGPPLAYSIWMLAQPKQ